MSSNQVTAKQAVAANLKVDPSGVTSPVSIATAPVLVAGTALIGKVGIDQTTPGTTNAVSAVLTTGSAAIGKLAANSGVDIGDVDVTSSALPTGASTAAKQPALGTAGTASTDVITVQGIASGTPLTVGGKTVVVAATLTRPSDTTAYAAGDSVSSSTSAPTILTFTSVARVSGGSGTIVRVLMTDSAYSATPGAYELWLLDTTTTPTNDNAAFAPSDGDVNTAVAIIPLTAVYSGTATAGTNGNMVYQAVGPFPFVTVGSANLFGIIVVRTAYTPISAEVFQVRLIVAQD